MAPTNDELQDHSCDCSSGMYSFQSIPVIPTKEEMMTKPKSVPVNKTAYSSWLHYADTHFRLLREDFLGPLRTAFKKLKTTGASGDMWIYKNVRFERSHLFLDDPDVKRIDWVDGSQFWFRSFLCISKDNFVTWIIGLVQEASDEIGKLGRVKIRTNPSDKDYLDSDGVFSVAECKNFFGGYYTFMSNLQTVDGCQLPFCKYVLAGPVGRLSRGKSPSYLKSDTVFDFAETFEFRCNKAAVNVPQDLTSQRPVQILNPEWPAAETLNLDTDQLKALKYALTHELAIIQGPPGTGKTFLGLRLVELLLRNRHSWTNEPSPILVVCVTNHALDQFLEGVLEYTDSIVRLGNATESEGVQDFTLNQLRSKMFGKGLIPRQFQRARNYLSKAKRSESSLLNELHKIHMGHVVDEESIRSCMSEDHFNTLVRGHVTPELAIPAMYYWLCEALMDIVEREGKIETVSRRWWEAVQGKSEITDVLLPLRRSEWMVGTKGQSIRKALCDELDRKDKMSNVDVNGVGDVWLLGGRDRWRLYRFWIALYKSHLQADLKDAKNDFKKAEKHFKCQYDPNVHIIRNSLVVGATTTGASLRRKLLDRVKPKIVIVEEAAEAKDCEVVLSLSAYCQHLILIGDHKQLRPLVSNHELTNNNKFDKSFFERMIDCGFPYSTLTLQHRMRPENSSLLVPHIYKVLRDAESVKNYEDVRGVSRNMYFLKHHFKEDCYEGSTSFVNEEEAKLVVAFCRYLRQQDYCASQITVLAAYRGQSTLMTEMMRDDVLFDNIRVTVVDDFQGEENDIVLLSLVRSNSQMIIGFLKQENRICVSLSRARFGFYAFGNFSMLIQRSPVWMKVVRVLEKNNAIGTSLRLACGNHPERVTVVRTADDFKRVAEGGCNRQCQFPLPLCGHLCGRPCHVYDKLHEYTHCSKPCSTVCENGHQCTGICGMPCDLCVEIMKVVKLKCGHLYPVRCIEALLPKYCKEICNKKLSCGHVCDKLCYQLCGDRCEKC